MRPLDSSGIRATDDASDEPDLTLRLLRLLPSLLGLLPPAVGAAELHWCRGNVHTHTNWAAPDVAVRRYHPEGSSADS